MILKKLAVTTCIFFFTLFVRSQSSVALTPPMGWNSWNKALADYMHAKGLKPGIYSDAATLTCGGVTGSYNFEERGATPFAKWGIDYLKYDCCNTPDNRQAASATFSFNPGSALKVHGQWNAREIFSNRHLGRVKTITGELTAHDCVIYVLNTTNSLTK